MDEFEYPPTLELIEDIVYGPERARPFLLDVLRPRSRNAQPVPAILFLHGGAWKLFNKYPQINVFLAMAGYVTVASSYRYSTEAHFPAQLEDAQSAVHWIRQHAGEYGVDAARIGAWGVSAGGHLASLLGVQAEVQAVVNVCGVTDLFDPNFPPDEGFDDLLGGSVQALSALARQASPALQVSSQSVPHLHVHGRHDAHVPLTQAERLHQALLEHGVQSRLEVIENGDHFVNQTHMHVIEPLVLEFFREVLGTP